MKMPLILLAQLGWRNIWRHRRRNLILISTIVFAVGSVVLTNALIRGFQYDMRDDAVRNLTGHIKVLAPGYRDDPSILQSFEVADEWTPDVAGADLKGWTRRVVVPAVVMSERETRGLNLVGIDPADERSISFLGDVGIEGEFLRDDGDARILLGSELAEQLTTQVGRRVVVITQGADGLNREAGFKIAGLFDAEGTGLEKSYVFTGRTALQALLDTDAVTEVSVRLTDSAGEAAAEASLALEMGGLEVKGWRELEPLAAAMFQYVDVSILILFVIVMLALSFGLVNTLITAVMERVREFGMLRAIGMRPAQIVIQVLIESTMVMVLGLLLGLAAGFGLTVYFADGIDLSAFAAGMEMAGMRSTLVPRLMMDDVVAVAIISVVLGLLGSGYPAWRAVRVNPLEALRRGT
ncbi:MAG: ABC transporter permease [Gammaproteobacteria bacterium]|nr:ABC transporter permease [Gammaproteobacteria bacterium]